MLQQSYLVLGHEPLFGRETFEPDRAPPLPDDESVAGGASSLCGSSDLAGHPPQQSIISIHNGTVSAKRSTEHVLLSSKDVLFSVFQRYRLMESFSLFVTCNRRLRTDCAQSAPNGPKICRMNEGYYL